MHNNEYGFTGKRFDQETGTYHFHFRQYDATTGVWLTPDPIGVLGGVNRYRYVNNNPVNLRDWLGLWEEDGDYGPMRDGLNDEDPENENENIKKEPSFLDYARAITLLLIDSYMEDTLSGREYDEPDFANGGKMLLDGQNGLQDRCKDKSGKDCDELPNKRKEWYQYINIPNKTNS